MRRMEILKFVLFFLAGLGMILPAPVLHAASTAENAVPPTPGPAVEVVDIELREGGLLLGQVVAADGKPTAKTTVSLRRGGIEVATTLTDRSGYFFVKGLRGGTYEIATDRTRAIYRLWAPNTAPPTARPGVLIVADGRKVRGQQGPIGYWLGNPWVIAGIVAAAVAVPVAIHNSRIDRMRSP